MKRSDFLRVEVKEIGPSDAQRILDDHLNFRNISQRYVQTYSRLMMENKWHLSILLFDSDGKLIDGQHRLAAVVRSGQPQEFVMLHGWPDDGVLSIDNGSNRTRAQSLKYAEPDITSTNKAAALAVGIENVMKDVKITNQEAVDIYRRYRDIVDELIPVLKAPLKGGIHGIAFARAIVSRPWQRKEIVEALRRTCELDFSDECMAGLRLYVRRVTSDKSMSHGGFGGRRATYLRCARALQAYLDREVIDKLYEPKEDPFPVEAILSRSAS